MTSVVRIHHSPLMQPVKKEAEVAHLPARTFGTFGQGRAIDSFGKN